ncbi:ABC transporter permease [Rhodococcus sp. NPDC059968]|uniref:ABC transporter permease n=1 Tax=Rhodococcus sp. NPDC059968 TaxID=3347017 RepID=UPI00366E9B35
MSSSTTTPVTPASAPTTSWSSLVSSSRLLEFAMFGVLALLIVIATIIYPAFLTPGNIGIILTQIAPLGIVAVGMTLVIIAGGFDLSVGAVFACAATVYTAMADSWTPGGAMVAALGLATVLGLVNGLVVTKLRVNPFITTLGTSSLYSGGVLFLTNAGSFSNTDEYFQAIGRGSIAGIRIPVVLLILAFLAGTIILDRTKFGRGIFAVGGSREAARLSGISVDVVQGSTYVISGFLAGLAGVITAGQVGAGQGSMGATIALDAIAIVVIGGTSLRGGEGRIWRTAVGMAIIAVLNNIFISLAVDNNIQLVAKGLIVILAVAADQLVRRSKR